MLASAPGKLVLLGDYAVLEGGRALVAAVDRRARAEASAHPENTSLEAAVRRATQARALAPLGNGVRVDTTTFRDDSGQKLGIGSSAAACVAAAAAFTGRTDGAALEIALEAHGAISGGGSGVDVAASFSGGVIVTSRQPAPIERAPLSCGALQAFVVYAGKSASTSALVAACRASPRWNEHASQLADLAEDGIAAWTCTEARFLDAVRRYARAMDALGRDAGVEIVTPAIAAAIRAAEARGGAAKPSGAGGGDVVVVFGDDPGLGAAVAAETGLSLVALAVDPRGVMLEV